MKNKKAISLALFFLLITAVSTVVYDREPAYANSGPPVSPDLNSGIVFAKHDSIKIASEVLNIETQLGSAQISAHYQMVNISEENQSVYTVFLSHQRNGSPRYANSDFYNYIVTKNDIPLETETEYYAYADFTDVVKNWADILTESNKITFENNEYDYKGYICAVSYTVDFLPGETLDLKVEYNCGMGHRYGNYRDYELIYYLSPAQYWQDFKDLTINLKLNEDTRVIKKSSIKFKKTAKMTYRYISETLPETELKIEVGRYRVNPPNAFVLFYLILPITGSLLFISAILIPVIIVLKRKKRLRAIAELCAERNE